MQKPFTVFLCSTFADLEAERAVVLDVAQRLQLQHASMEFFGARANRPLETCLDEVRRSDIVIVIAGHHYGAIVPELGISFSEAEYAEGCRLNKPFLVYIKDDTPLPENTDRDPVQRRHLAQWKQTLLDKQTVFKFHTVQELAVQVAADLSRTIQTLSARLPFAIHCGCGEKCKGAKGSSNVPLCSYERTSHQYPQEVRPLVFLSRILRNNSTNVDYLVFQCPACQCRTTYRYISGTTRLQLMGSDDHCWA